ncbi:hypothetical protein GGR88_002222 [Sphingomonas jejuensis]|jgi:hypothetical protein|uniref:PilZ domain-containing protein n=1 Tax=Sphingomonas jejuensis TaxID=904715 RepID=A0ABX0XMV9_9SPHN|nr:hypothetical protein [Sphingomonas jejuensis]NJC34708.1 hypothetical protein [Sphingomonas jejuensis]
MKLAGRLALESGADQHEQAVAGSRRACGYHGIDILVNMLSADGFTAEMRGLIPPGAQVRLKLPGLGAAHARVLSSEDGHLHARFANPIGLGRLARVPGFSRIAA